MKTKHYSIKIKREREADFCWFHWFDTETHCRTCNRCVCLSCISLLDLFHLTYSEDNITETVLQGVSVTRVFLRCV